MRRDCRVGDAHVLWLVILVDDNVWLAPATADLDGGNLLAEPAALLGVLCLLVAANAVLVLVLPGEAVVIGTLLALQTHVLLLVGIGQTVLEDTIDQRLVTKLGSIAHVGKVVRGVGHGLGTTSNDNVGGAGEDGLSGKDDGLDAGGADLVDGGADDGLLETSSKGALTSRVLAEAAQGQRYGARRVQEIWRAAYLAERTLPKTTSSTCSGLRPDLSTAAKERRGQIRRSDERLGGSGIHLMAWEPS